MESELALGRALAAANSGITLADATREGFPLTFVNAAFEQLTGFRGDEVLGRNCRFLQGAGTDPGAVAEVAAALHEGRETTQVLLNYRRDGTPFYNELRLAPVCDRTGRIVQVVGVQNDVTDLTRAQRSLRRATRVIAEQDQELAELRVLQRALTPADPPSRPHLELATSFLAAEEGVAGDFHLVAAAPRDATVVVVGDVIGHGLEAARRATFVRTVLATFARFGDAPARLLEMGNQALIERTGPTHDFVTAVCVAYRPDEQRLRWASAGHPPPVRLDRGEPVTGAGGPPLGIGTALDAPEHAMAFAPGDGLLLFTDGLPEARAAARGDRRAPHFGDERLRATVRSLRAAAPAAVVGALRDAATGYVGGRFADDVCIVALRAT